MRMHMVIVMHMNIYITKANEEYLKNFTYGKSMSGLINKLIDEYRIEYDRAPRLVEILPGGLPEETQQEILSKPIKTKADAEKVIKQKFPEVTYKKTGSWGA